MIEKVNLAQKFTSFSEQWVPKIAGEINGCHVRLAKLQGEFVWHHHENEDEMFLVVKGTHLIKLRNQNIELNEGEFVVIPRGVEHLPVAAEEAHVMMFEPDSTLNTGNVYNGRTVNDLQRI